MDAVKVTLSLYCFYTTKRGVSKGMSMMLGRELFFSLQVFMECCSGIWPARAHIFCGARLVRHLRSTLIEYLHFWIVAIVAKNNLCWLFCSFVLYFNMKAILLYGENTGKIISPYFAVCSIRV